MSRSQGLLVVALVLGVLHHVDHVLRVDHSGWPFLPEVTPFTFSFLVYPLILSALPKRTARWYRIGVVALVFTAVQSAHVFLEPPIVQYSTWARGYSTEPWATGRPNLLGYRSAVLGIASAGVSILLGLALLSSLVSLTLERRLPGRMAARRRA